MRRLCTAIAVLGLLGIATSAGAISLYVDWGLRDGIAGGRLAGETWTAQVGAYAAREGGPGGEYLGLFYCVDLNGSLSLRRIYEYTEHTTDHPDLNQDVPNGEARGNGSTVAWVYNTYGRSAPDRTTAGATQVALWELLYDDDYDLATGNFTVTGHGLGFDYDLAQSIVSSAVDERGLSAYFKHADPEVRAQDLIGPVEPIPEPASMILLGLGLLGGGIAYRRRRL